jgi:hypothetical protein
MRTLVALVHQRFNGCGRIRLVEQKPMDVWNCDIRLHVPEDFKSGLNGNLGFGREKWILAAASGQRGSRIDNHLCIRGSGNVRVARNVDRVNGPPKLIFS